MNEAAYETAGIVAVYGYQAYQVSVDEGIGEKYAAAETTAQLQAFITANPNHQLAGVAQLRIADEAYAAGKYADAADLATAFQNGEMMGYEHMSSGGMGEVQTNLSKLPPEDLAAIAAFITSLK